MAFDRCDMALSYYRHADFVLAMRGHGQIVPLGFGVPVVALSNHPKHLGLMRKLGLAEYCVEIDDEDLTSKVETAVDSVDTRRSQLIDNLRILNAQMLNSTALAFSKLTRSLENRNR
jgi:polysaccharide pyruvyl transferase WcaK-like protein